MLYPDSPQELTRQFPEGSEVHVRVHRRVPSGVVAYPVAMSVDYAYEGDGIHLERGKIGHVYEVCIASKAGGYPQAEIREHLYGISEFDQEDSLPTVDVDERGRQHRRTAAQAHV